MKFAFACDFEKADTDGGGNVTLTFKNKAGSAALTLDAQHVANMLLAINGLLCAKCKHAHMSAFRCRVRVPSGGGDSDDCGCIQ